MAHTCHARGCGKAVPPKMLMCPKHWFMVPKVCQRQVWKHYRDGQENDKRPSLLYMAAAKAAIEAVAKLEGTPPPAPKQEELSL